MMYTYAPDYFCNIFTLARENIWMFIYTFYEYVMYVRLPHFRTVMYMSDTIKKTIFLSLR